MAAKELHTGFRSGDTPGPRCMNLEKKKAFRKRLMKIVNVSSSLH